MYAGSRATIRTPHGLTKKVDIANELGSKKFRKIFVKISLDIPILAILDWRRSFPYSEDEDTDKNTFKQKKVSYPCLSPSQVTEAREMARLDREEELLDGRIADPTRQMQEHSVTNRILMASPLDSVQRAEARTAHLTNFEPLIDEIVVWKAFQSIVKECFR
ncbi:unnamed protein product [Nippostrongylus brasiliensis]|uniref:Uncharacterized protein n=1 Tax=Nippostrongylus brasiliensis TaxID=27835 RepID=A0A158QY78_NIPBR|nr:unnamed protein product [Nippostrongylus brasiliensis]